MAAPTNKEIEQIEKRAELAVKVSALEERSLNTQKQLTGIENGLTRHATDEEQMLRDINESIRDVKKDLDDKISDHVDKKLEPIRDEIRDAKTVFKVISAILSFIGAVIVMAWDQIAKWLFH